MNLELPARERWCEYSWGKIQQFQQAELVVIMANKTNRPAPRTWCLDKGIARFPGSAKKPTPNKIHIAMHQGGGAKTGAWTRGGGHSWLNKQNLSTHDEWEGTASEAPPLLRGP